MTLTPIQTKNTGFIPMLFTLTSHKGNYHRILPTYAQAKRIAEILGYCGLDACIIPIVGGVA